MTNKEVREAIIDTLSIIQREGINELLDYLVSTDFYTAPASTRYHGCYEGGLAQHSYDVYFRLLMFYRTLNPGKATGLGQNPLPLTEENIAIAAILHDVCKVDAYRKTKKPDAKVPYYWNKATPKGHAILSISRIKSIIELEPIEELIIRYHMGVYGLNEFYGPKDWGSGEYPLRGDHINTESMSKEESKKYRYGKSLANAWYHNPICKLAYFADELATLSEKQSESK